LFSRLRQLPRAHPRLGLLLRVSAWAATLGYFAFALLLLALRYAILPQIESYRGDIEQMIGTAINRPVGIRRIEAHWAGLRPALTLEGFEIRDAQGRPALGFDEVEAELSWSSLWHFQLRLARLELNAPMLSLRRDREGGSSPPGWKSRRIRRPTRNLPTGCWSRTASSCAMPPSPGRTICAGAAAGIEAPEFPARQQLRPPSLRPYRRPAAPACGAHRHPRRLQGPRPRSARGLEGRGLRRTRLRRPRRLAHWVDYPVNLPQGNGALRLWLGFASKQLQTATADVRLADVRLQLRRDLPELDMVRLEGRIAGRRLDGGFEAELKHLTLATRDGVALRRSTSSWPGRGPPPTVRHRAGSANGLDLDAMADLAAHLPLDDATRARLARHAPRGRVYRPETGLERRPEALAAAQAWSVKSRFEGLGLTALGPVPGMSGINGRVDGNEKGGSVQLNGQRAAFELPTVFADPKLELEAFAADLAWRPAPDGLQVKLNEVTFHNKDAAGDANGVWQRCPKGRASSISTPA
jgi:uncharacterized protein YhdP